MNPSSRRAVLAADLSLFLVAVVWGAGFPFCAHLLEVLSPLWMVALRLSLSALFLLVLFRRRVREADREAWRGSLALGTLMTGVFVLLALGLAASSPGKQAFISGTYVVQVPFLLWLLYRRRPSLFAFGGALVVSLGLGIMAFTPGMRFVAGDLYNAVLALGCACQVLAIGWLARRIDPLTLTTLHLSFAALFLTALALLLEPLPSLALGAVAWGELLFVSLGGTVVAFLVQCTAQRFTPESHAAVIMSLESPFGYLIAVWLGLDPWSPRAVLGGLLILGGVLLTEWETFLRREAEAA